MITQRYLNELTYKIIGAAIEVHKELGPGLLESVYEKCIVYVLRQMGLNVEQQKKVPLFFKGILIDCDLRFDLLVEDLIVVELKAVNNLMPIFDTKLLTYMKLLKKPKGILINFNCTNIQKEGQKTLVNELYSQLSKGY